MGLFADTLGSLPVLPVAHERLPLAKEQVANLEQKVAEMQPELEKRDTLIEELRQQVIPKEFVECHGILLRRLAGGDFDSYAYCPECKLPMHPTLPDGWGPGPPHPLCCGKCRWIAPINSKDLAAIIADQARVME